jgi:uncharacterized protein
MIDDVFDWDDEKAALNLQKHHVSFKEAATIFTDPNVIEIFDPAHSDDESRFLAIGFSNRGRLLAVAYTPRGQFIRIITARIASKRLEKLYED